MSEIKWQLSTDPLAMDIWLIETEIPTLRSMIASLRQSEMHWLMPENTPIYDQSKITMDEVLSMVATMYGNNPDRTITILKENNEKEYWKPLL